MQTLIQVRSKPAIVGDLTQNLSLLNQDSNDIAAEILRIEDAQENLYNLAAASQNALRQLIRQSIYISNQQQFIAHFIDDLCSSSWLYRDSRLQRQGSATLPLGKQTTLSPTFAVGVASSGSAVNDISNLSLATGPVHNPSFGPDPPWNCFCLFPAPRE